MSPRRHHRPPVRLDETVTTDRLGTKEEVRQFIQMLDELSERDDLRPLHVRIRAMRTRIAQRERDRRAS